MDATFWMASSWARLAMPEPSFFSLGARWRLPAMARTAVRITSKDDQAVIVAPVVIAAHGSWEQGKLPTNLPKSSAPHDPFGLKAHFKGASLARDFMPLLVFTGGYGGMVWADHDRTGCRCHAAYAAIC
ncbi:hypothetical protein BPNPMPFG_008380 (plasmid) [Mesorhizobium sp. AR07]|uniref:hypothetical protein n=1 Tax=Mesorhizobium sp. AR07 TaxID=2865838 RepID=UPI00215DF54A|nr:hypothetical protein [Mesorhizobium sp. AR07]UVK49413.1 hypothetical protein BPNPMPFG_008380 [Mesorhizobium sp. AR07]